LGRPPVKSTKACAMAKRKGELEAETKFWDKQPLTKKLQRLLWRKLEQIDPLKFVGLVTTTIVIHGAILEAPALKKKALLYMPLTIGLGLYGATIAWFADELGLAADKQAEKLDDSPAYWILAVCLAYMLVEHGGEIAGMLLDGGKSFGTMAATLTA